MGKFDLFKINTALLPILEEDKEYIGNDPEWQTKDLKCTQSWGWISDDGQLKFLTNDDWGLDEFIEFAWDIDACINDKGCKWVELNDFTGDIVFYTSDDKDRYWEFKANVVSGKLVKIEPLMIRYDGNYSDDDIKKHTEDLKKTALLAVELFRKSPTRQPTWLY